MRYFILLTTTTKNDLFVSMRVYLLGYEDMVRIDTVPYKSRYYTPHITRKWIKNEEKKLREKKTRNRENIYFSHTAMATRH